MATGPPDLRASRTLWQGRRNKPQAVHRLIHDLQTEVQVIGTGITDTSRHDLLCLAGNLLDQDALRSEGKSRRAAGA
jgi:hypothetical protein